MSTHYPDTKRVDGFPGRYRAYVRASKGRRIVRACGHLHRTKRTAERCAEKMLRAVEKAVP